MTDSPTAPDAAPLTDPGPPPPRPPRESSSSERFFGWARGLGVTRSDGWVGGVCAGIAARLGIDPVIVRGIFVVAALFGLPMFVIYAVGWALLPDLSGRIHFQELLRRRFDPAMVGIGLMLVVGLFPVVPWFFAAVFPFGYLSPVFDWSPLGVLWTLFLLALLGGLIFLIARSSSRRASSTGGTDPRRASADPSSPGSLAFDDSGVDAQADPTGAGFAPVGSAPLPPPRPENDADLGAWRAQHEAWRAQDAAWRRQQQDADRAARDHARRERAAAGAAFAAEAAEQRRIRRASRPRTSGAFVALSMGAALVLGAATSLWSSSLASDEPGVAVACGLLAASIVVALSMILAGALRRRSGFLAFVAVVLLIAGVSTAVPSVTRGIAFGSVYMNNLDPRFADTDAREFTQLWGQLTIDLGDNDVTVGPIVVDKRDGSTDIAVEPGVALDLEVTGLRDVEWMRFDGRTGRVVDEGTWSAPSGGAAFVRERIDNREYGDAGTRQTVELDQSSGTVFVTIYEN